MSNDVLFSLKKKRDIYTNSNGDRVPSVTTLLNLRSKPQLDAWKSKLWKEGKDPKAEAEREANRGKLMHGEVEAILRGGKLIIPPQELSDDDLANLGHIEIKTLAGAFGMWWEKMKAHGYRLVDTEIVMVDEENGFGGTIDILVEDTTRIIAWTDACRVGMSRFHTEIWDIKTGKDFYPEQRLQVGGGYTQLALANNITVDACRIIRIPKVADASNDFPEMQTINHIPALQQEFMTLLSLYKCSKYSERQEMQNASPRNKLADFA